ncbi:MAG: DUF2778 domain-containing protein [Pseudolabrys sp.]|nr:DUF2778 domain-containing protein [Pseudolabrys sp.]
MRVATATIASVYPRYNTAFPVDGVRRVLRAAGINAALGAGALAAVGASGLIAVVAAAWVVSAVLATNPDIYAKPVRGPGGLAIAESTSLDVPWKRGSPRSIPVALVTPGEASRLLFAAPPQNAAPIPAQNVPLPQARPGSLAAAPLAPLAVETTVAALVTPVITPPVTASPPPAASPPPPAVPQQAHTRGAPLPDPDGRTAVYDISARTVFLPSGEKLEAHSGFGDKMDDPRHVHVRMRGATPPNVYDLRLRERLFHGVRAIRLTPVDEGRMFGRDGILAHSYLLGPNGQSNGCVSLKDYDRFLQAFLSGEIDRIVVVPDGGTKIAEVVRAKRGQSSRMASNTARRQTAAQMPAEPSMAMW